MNKILNDDIIEDLGNEKKKKNLIYTCIYKKSAPEMLGNTP